jgi:hypothetical protein
MASTNRDESSLEEKEVVIEQPFDYLPFGLFESPWDETIPETAPPVSTWRDAPPGQRPIVHVDAVHYVTSSWRL